MSSRLYLVTRRDLSEGYRAAQLVHASQVWAALYEPHMETVIVYEVPDLHALESLHDDLPGDKAKWLEPDLGNELTAFATTSGPLPLPLLGRRAA